MQDKFAYRNPGFSTWAAIDPSSYDPQGAGESIWKQNNVQGTAVRVINAAGNTNAWITIEPFPAENVTIEGDGDICFSIRSSAYVRIKGLNIVGVKDRLPTLLAWRYWGTYRYLQNGNYVYGDRKTDICSVYNISPCTDIPPNVLTTGDTYMGLPNIDNLNIERPNIFGGKGLLVQLSHHIEVLGNTIHDFPGGGLRATQSDYVTFRNNSVYNNTGRASVGTHGLVVEGLTPESGNNDAIEKMTIDANRVYSNYNELYSWVQSKTIVTTHIDEGKGIALLRTSSSQSGLNGFIRVENNLAWDNGKSGIHTNDVDNAEIYNNTVYLNGHTNIYNPTLTGGTNAGISIQSSNNIKIVNNIAVVTNGLLPALQALSEGQNCAGEIVTNNLVWGGATSDFAGGYIIADPVFNDILNNDVTLQATSPAIDNGTATNAPFDDFLSLARNMPPEIGAFEYTAPVSGCMLSIVVANGSTCSGVETDLATLVQDADGGNLTYYTSQAAAESGTGALPSSMVAPFTSTDYYVRSTNSAGCFDVKKIMISMKLSTCGSIQVSGPHE